MPKKLPTYIVTRRGDFNVDLEKAGQCGPAGTSAFSYLAVIEGSTLDREGFLVEHYAMHDQIERHFAGKKWHASCEALAATVLRIIQREAGGRASRIHVTIKPGAVAEIALEWRVGHSLPTLVATRV